MKKAAGETSAGEATMEVRYYTKPMNKLDRLRSKGRAWHKPEVVENCLSLEIAHGDAVDPWWDRDKEYGWGTLGKTQLLVKDKSDGAPVLIVTNDGGDILIYYPDRTLKMETEEFLLLDPFRAASHYNENGMERTKLLRFKLREPWSAAYY